MDKRIENAMNELINTEIWSTGLYLSLQVYFEDERLPILSSWLNSQAQDNMNKVYQVHLGRGVRKPAEGLEEPFVLDDPGLLERVGKANIRTSS